MAGLVHGMRLSGDTPQSSRFSISWQCVALATCPFEVIGGVEGRCRRWKV